MLATLSWALARFAAPPGVGLLLSGALLLVLAALIVDLAARARLDWRSARRVARSGADRVSRGPARRRNRGGAAVFRGRTRRLRHVRIVGAGGRPLLDLSVGSRAAGPVGRAHPGGRGGALGGDCPAGLAMSRWRVSRREVERRRESRWRCGCCRRSCSGAAAQSLGWRTPALAIVAGTVAAAVAAFYAPRWGARFRRAPQAARLLALFRRPADSGAAGVPVRSSGRRACAAEPDRVSIRAASAGAPARAPGAARTCARPD